MNPVEGLQLQMLGYDETNADDGSSSIELWGECYKLRRRLNCLYFKLTGDIYKNISRNYNHKGAIINSLVNTFS